MEANIISLITGTIYVNFHTVGEKDSHWVVVVGTVHQKEREKAIWAIGTQNFSIDLS